MKIAGKPMLLLAGGLLLLLLFWGFGGCEEQPRPDQASIRLANNALKLAAEVMAEKRVKAFIATLMGGIGFLVAISLPALVMCVLVLIARRSAAEDTALEVIEELDRVLEMTPKKQLNDPGRGSLPGPGQDEQSR